ncbi:Hypothetical Protein FCC1311_057312 [Hondaea fermentalgiana]|uniref:Uncharacterized protein n=1 Tax=Hondaea fermentalgiana TaxID=2315210 RepID=A0A2R5GF12_9STRA|nr:Hypothetical Protein FCC1311_057312 [Hondaea fermentalgiana]|eukprot:GBG29510.1 Hypothetical Protein FCC1311_057312 [Hondaea fermentalgiana]
MTASEGWAKDQILVDGLTYVLICFLVLTTTSLVAIDLFERCGGHGAGWKSFIAGPAHAAAEDGLDKDPEAEEVHEAGDDAVQMQSAAIQDSMETKSFKSVRALLKKTPPPLARVVQNPQTPEKIRTFTKGLLVVWGALGIVISGILIANFLRYVQDNKYLQTHLVDIVNASSGDAGIAGFDAGGNTSATGWQIQTEYFLIPGPLVEEVMHENFDVVANDSSFELYGVDWVQDRCTEITCLDMDYIDTADTDGSFEIIFVAAPMGTNPILMLLLVVALAIDALTFSAFGLLVCLRWRTITVEKSRKSAMVLETALVLISGILLGVLVYLALAVPVEYESIGFVSRVGDRDNVVPVTAKKGVMFPVKYEYDYVIEVETDESTLWCPSLAMRLLLGNQYNLEFTDSSVSDSVNARLLTGPVDPATVGCRYVGGKRQRSLVSNATYWDEVIDFIQDQVVHQGVTVDGLLIAMDCLVLVATYLFIIL